MKINYSIEQWPSRDRFFLPLAAQINATNDDLFKQLRWFFAAF